MEYLSSEICLTDERNHKPLCYSQSVVFCKSQFLRVIATPERRFFSVVIDVFGYVLKRPSMEGCHKYNDVTQ